MKIRMICAMDYNQGIGYKNSLPWNFKEDLKFFSKITKGSGNNAVIMGKNTYFSLNKNLPLRDNLILSSCKTIPLHSNSQNVCTFQNIDSCMIHCHKKDYDEVWVIGGSQIYQQFLNSIDIIIHDIVITHIHKSFTCDCFFPPFKTKFNHEETLQTNKDFSIKRYFK